MKREKGHVKYFSHEELEKMTLFDGISDNNMFLRIYYRYERFDYKYLKTGILILDFSKRYSKEILLTERKRKQ
ncbi:MAG: hypothetical protein PHS04_17165 [Tissierellia bacterium]|nr:hypothetical protein [Tissierellia bacterium]